MHYVFFSDFSLSLSGTSDQAAPLDRLVSLLGMWGRGIPRGSHRFSMYMVAFVQIYKTLTLRRQIFLWPSGILENTCCLSSLAARQRRLMKISQRIY